NQNHDTTSICACEINTPGLVFPHHSDKWFRFSCADVAVSFAEFPEMVELERMIEHHASLLDVRTLGQVKHGEHRFPLYVIGLGTKNLDAPAVGFFGGVHGLERIGTQVLLAFLNSLLSRLQWDRLLQRQLSSIRLVFMPLVNPAGMFKA